MEYLVYDNYGMVQLRIISQSVVVDG